MKSDCTNAIWLGLEGVGAKLTGLVHVCAATLAACHHNTMSVQQWKIRGAPHCGVSADIAANEIKIICRNVP